MYTSLRETMTTSTSTTINNEEAYPLHNLAKVLNNRAAHVITTMGNHEEGINLLAKALKLTERSIMLESSSKKDQQVPCSCKFCSFESCLVLSEERKHQSSHYQEEKAAEEDNDGIGFVYRRLLLIDDYNINKNHYMGSTLSLVIIFNLALTHHLMGTRESSSPSNTTNLTKNNKLLQHAVKFYELAYQLHVNHTEQQSLHTYNNNDYMMDDDDHEHDNNNRAVVVSLRLTMIVANNLGQIHRVVGNSNKYTLWLQHLLSSIMYVGQQLVPNAVLNSTEFDGLIRNVSPIVFKGSICASAA